MSGTMSNSQAMNSMIQNNNGGISHACSSIDHLNQSNPLLSQSATSMRLNDYSHKKQPNYVQNLNAQFNAVAPQNDFQSQQLAGAPQLSMDQL